MRIGAGSVRRGGGMRVRRDSTAQKVRFLKMARLPGLQHSAQKVRFLKMASPGRGAYTARNKLRWPRPRNNQITKIIGKAVRATNNSDKELIG